MNYYPVSIRNVIKGLSKLPGIGEKTAERLAMHILRAPNDEALKLSRSIAELKEKTKLCTKCFALSDGDICDICSDPSRDRGLLCVVEQPAEMVAIEKSGAYNGLYHILQGLLSPVEGIGPKDIRIDELRSRAADGRIREIVIATGTSVEGESTASYIAEAMAQYRIKITRIASGVPIGGDLKYVDQITLRRAMETRYVL